MNNTFCLLLLWMTTVFVSCNKDVTPPLSVNPLEGKLKVLTYSKSADTQFINTFEYDSAGNLTHVTREGKLIVEWMDTLSNPLKIRLYFYNDIGEEQYAYDFEVAVTGYNRVSAITAPVPGGGEMIYSIFRTVNRIDSVLSTQYLTYNPNPAGFLTSQMKFCQIENGSDETTLLADYSYMPLPGTGYFEQHVTDTISIKLSAETYSGRVPHQTIDFLMPWGNVGNNDFMLLVYVLQLSGYQLNEPLVSLPEEYSVNGFPVFRIGYTKNQTGQIVKMEYKDTVSDEGKLEFEYY